MSDQSLKDRVRARLHNNPNIRPNKLSQEQREEIVSMFADGISMRQLAQLFDCTPGAIRYHVEKAAK